ncbi:MAG: hypothetical protein ABS75_31475 [Pelagibacterium sp. SCN 63-23]|nr:MAG: hypothetical protein ABS75_31475 [Pelagibacterium sp. SCN 63-23]
MGPDRAKALGLLLAVLLTAPVLAQQPGWHYSPLPGEGDRASMGCDRNATPDRFTCLVVRCSDDFSIDIHPYSSRAHQTGIWETTIDREARQMEAIADDTSYGARFADDGEWLYDRLRHGTFVYLRHSEDAATGFDYIDLTGSFRSIAQALYWCAPRAAESGAVPVQQHIRPDMKAGTIMENPNESSAPRTQ